MTKLRKQIRKPSPGKEQLNVLAHCYRIEGDGIARLRLSKAVTHPKFRASILKLSAMEINQ